jgi:hypothetical protein
LTTARPSSARTCSSSATADADGRPQCSYKGGAPGFVRVLDERTVAFPSYDGNGMYLSTGNVLQNPRVGMLFIDHHRHAHQPRHRHARHRAPRPRDPSGRRQAGEPENDRGSRASGARSSGRLTASWLSNVAKRCPGAEGDGD